ncbi:MAG: hypothetical protein AAGA55_00880 [Planctomycetota bacterium]
MISMLVLYFLLLAAIITAVMIRDAFSGAEELISLRNFFLVGMLIFQVTSASYLLATDYWGEFYPSDLPSAAAAYAMKLTIFIVIFFGASKAVTGIIDRFFARRQRPPLKIAPYNTMLIAIATIPVGLLCQFVFRYIPIIGPGMGYLAFGLYAVGAGLATWTVAPRLYNPAYLIGAAAVILMGMALTFYENFGRRDLLGIVVAIVWAAYYCRWRSMPVQQLIVRLGILSAAGVALLFAVTSVRSPEFRGRGIVENVIALKDAKLSDGLGDVLSGQAAPIASMWLIESRPNSKEYDTLHSARMALLMPIPRRVWPEKPTALALTMPQQEVHIPQRPDNYNIGPGLIGHIENDNPWIALWLYPIALGVIMRICDRTTAWYADNPFVVLPIGAAVGQFIGMPRGELGSFFFIGMINIVGAFVIMQTLSIALRTLGLIKESPEEYDDAEAYGDLEYGPDDIQPEQPQS